MILFIAYGSLLESGQREEDGIFVEDEGIHPMIGYKPSFDRNSQKRWKGGVLNLRNTGNPEDVYYVKVFETNQMGFEKVIEREGPYKKFPIKTHAGNAFIFLIPDSEISLTAASKKYVKVVVKGLKENFSCNKLSHNLRALKNAIIASGANINMYEI